MDYLAIIEQDGAAHGGLVPELNVSVTGKTPEQVRERLEQGAALAIYYLEAEGRTVPTPRLQTFADLPADLQEVFSADQVTRVAPAKINPESVAVAQAIDRSGLTDTEIARRMGTSPAGISRLKNFFYWAHNSQTLRKLSEALGEPVTTFAKKTALQDRLYALGESVIPPEDRQRAGPLSFYGNLKVEFRAIASDGTAVNFRSRADDLSSPSMESPVITVRGTDDQGRPAALTGHVDTLQFAAVYLGFEEKTPAPMPL
jgi:predicted RNase H-like HicB family nuclease/transcriptional regulator with XRE-family HTH domain